MMKLYLAVPCYNEEEVIHDTTQKLSHKLEQLITENKISSESKIVYINDGSKDKTWSIIESLFEKNKFVCGIKLSRNKGHQNALIAGLYTLKDTADAVISIDADLQDDINAIDVMIDKYNEGCDIVYGVRTDRKTDGFLKRTTAEMYYKFLSFMGAEVIYNHADFRLMSKKAINALLEYKEVNLYLRGLVPLIGFKSDCVYYERKERTAGQSKYPIIKMFDLAWQGITSFSIKPIRLITGFSAILISLCIFSWIWMTACMINNITLPSWVSPVLSIWTVGGLQLFAIGIIGEYIGKVNLEAKARPKFHIDKSLLK